MDATSVSTTVSTGDTTALGEKNFFHVVDYCVFGAMLLISALIGIFFAVKNRRKTTVSTDDYLMASRSMSYGPVSMSLIASFMSSVTILGVPAEFYVYGTMFAWFAIVYAIVSVIVGWVYMPVFYDLGISSTYEYLERRFNRPVRMIATIMFIILSILYGGIVVYGPALALSEATGFNMWSAILSTGLVCIFYTTLGGLKAVIWTDVFQAMLMICGFIAVIIQGSMNLGGFLNIWKAAESGGRIDFIHFEADPRIRNTFWSIMIGGPVFWLGVNAVNQTQVQRYICCKTKRDAQLAIILNALGLIVILILAGMTGLTIYATYKDCDPLDSNKIKKPDQLFPYAVMDLLGSFPGIPGLFVAAIYSSSLSTLSSAMNAMACVTLEDFIKPYTRWLPRTYTVLSKLMVLLFGATFILFAFLASQLGGLIEMAYSVHGIVGGPALALFTVGIMMPFVNEWGALVGVFCGWGTTIWMFVGALYYPRPVEYLRKLPRSTAGCDSHSNLSTFAPTIIDTTFVDDFNVTSQSNVNGDGSPWIVEFYHLSYLYLTLVGFVVTVLVAMLVSLITCFTLKSHPDDELLVSCFSRSKKKGRPPLERSSSWYSPSDIANAQRITFKTNNNGKADEHEPLFQNPDVIAALQEDKFIPERETSF